MSKPGVDPTSGISLGDAWDGPSGIRHVGGAKLNLALVRNVRTWPAMPREKAQAAPIARLKVLMRRRGADCLVVVLKRGNARGAKGAGHRRWVGSTGVGSNRQREEPDAQGEGQPSWSCNTRKLIPTVLPGLVVTEDQASCLPRRRRRPRCRIGLDVGLLQRRRSWVFWPRRTARPALAGSEQSYGGKVCTRRR